MNLLASTFVLIILLVITQGLGAESIRCGTNLIQSELRVGVTEYEVNRDCGAPVARKGNRWLYERPGVGIKILVFNDAGQLVAVHDRR